MNFTPPDHMTAEERLDEVASILATGIRRMLDKRKREKEKVLLDNSPRKRPYGRKSTMKENGDD
jgi:hypothetical protein